MDVLGWLFATTVIGTLTLAWWIVSPFYLGGYRKASDGRTRVTMAEQVTTVVAGVVLAGAWWLIALGPVRLIKNLG